MIRNYFFAASLLALSAYPVAAWAGDMPSGIKTGDTAMGPVLTDAKGMTLYTFNPDPMEKSVCNGKCAQNWPPVMAPSNAMADGDFTVVVRDDGSHQWAYHGKPLYGWVKDKKPGDTTGDGVANKWTVAKP